MKKIKILMPILAIGTIAPTIMSVASCGNSAENVALDTTVCTAEQTTDANITMNTYVFSVKNFDTEKEELTAEISNAETSDDVSIEITSTEYKAEEKKFYVYITTSKEEGTLNDGETVKFSILFKCLNKETQEVKWEKTIDSLVIKHTESEEVSQHFIDTDVNKVLTTNKTGEQTMSLTFSLGDVAKWTNKDITDMYNIANLSVQVYQSDLAKLSKITIGDVTLDWGEPTEVEGTNIYTSLTVYVKINVPENIKEATTTYNLYFEYSSPEMLVKDTWRQTIGGFKVNFGEHYDGSHSELACSRERYYYKDLNSETENAQNYVVVRLLDDHAASYKAEDFEVSTSNENITIGSELITYKLEDPVHATQYYYYLAIPYSIKSESERWHEPKDCFNVAITLKSNASGYEWAETYKGFTFFNRVDYKNKSLVYYENKEQVDPIKTLQAGVKKTITNKFKTISPIDMSYIVLSGAYCDDIDDIEFDINSLNWEHSEVDITLPSDTEAGNYQISYVIMVATTHCAYKYTLTVETEVTTA